MRIPRSVAAFAGVALLAGALRLWDLASVGFGNLYYAATVKSMLRSPFTFLYASFDPEGFVTVDKPPLGLWTQAALAKVAGFSGLALQLPQAVAGTLSVLVLGRIVARDFGLAAGAIAALVLAITPVAVAVDRNNTMDAQLVLLLLVATYAVLRAAERASLRWLALAGVLVGLAFNVKMAEAYVPVPAFVFAYLAGSRARVTARLAHAVAFCAVTVAVSLAWIAVVDLTPPDGRPFVSSSRDNTALDLALGHNGAARLPQELLALLRPAAPAPAGPPPPGARPPAAPSRPSAPVQPPPGSGPNDEAGARGPLRLFNHQLAGQASWFIPLALVGVAALLVREGWRWPLSRAQVVTALWLAWLLPAVVLFSWSGIFHRYYLVMLSPPLAALCGAGAVALVALARERRFGAIGLATAALLTAYVEIAIVTDAGAFAPWLVPVIGTGAVIAIASGVVVRVAPRRVSYVSASIALACFLAGPLAWASTTLVAADAGLPYAGPDLLARRPRPPGSSAPAALPLPSQDPLLAYMLANHRDERFVLAVGTSGTAAPYMLRADVAVMAMGGFSGGDPILTPATLEKRIRSGDVRFVLIEERMPRDLVPWLRSRCAVVPPERWRGPIARPGAPPPVAGPGGAATLVDCARVRGGT